MRKFSLKKAAVVGAAGVIVASGAGVAFAYWTANGTGTGTASTGTTQGITVNQTSTIAGLYPGGAAAGLSGNFDNTNASKVFVNQVSVAIKSGWSSSLVDGSKPACTASDFTLVQPAATQAEIASATAVGSWGGASIALNDNPSANQDNCKGVSVPLVYTSN
jgi:hypothetical protein